ncbi:regulator of G-protein signaling 9-binding protein-like [Pezoporus occidentalis]|uniref:regulator of G-protein signaling 9-binding protein-like n=1 Tax=Pezoporus occidentalis TaxID=407982 RepID=UPI002F910BE4
MWGQREQHRAAGGTGARSPEPGATMEGLDPATASGHTMALRRADACRLRGAAGTCAAAQATLCKAMAGHRQLVLQLGGSADGPRLREERRRRSAEARELSSGLRCALLAGLRQAPGSPEERRELERLWVLFLSALELFLQDLRRAHRLCQLFSLQGDGAAPLRTGLGNRRGGGPVQPPAAPCLEEEIEQVRATLAEMESRANIPLWTVEATQSVGTGSTMAVSGQGGPHAGPCCRVL